MTTETVKRLVGAIGGTGWMSYVLAGLIGASLAVVYLVVVNQALTKFTAPATQEATAATTELPLQTPTAQPPPTGTPTPSAPKVVSKPPNVSETSARTVQHTPQHTPRNAERGDGINQTMTNSAGGIQAGGDVTIGERPKPTPTEEKKNP